MADRSASADDTDTAGSGELVTEVVRRSSSRGGLLGGDCSWKLIDDEDGHCWLFDLTVLSRTGV